jgi:hypothetical protein
MLLLQVGLVPADKYVRAGQRAFRHANMIFARRGLGVLIAVASPACLTEAPPEQMRELRIGSICAEIDPCSGSA